MAGVDRKLIKEHFAKQEIKKLNLGSGYHVLDGWLNADVFPPLKKVLKIDATKKYPFDDQTFDYVFSQHTIEHISYAQGQQMLKECFRILKDGGKIRISTPDLLFLISLYQSEKSEQAPNPPDTRGELFTPPGGRGFQSYPPQYWGGLGGAGGTESEEVQNAIKRRHASHQNI